MKYCHNGCGRIVADVDALCQRCREKELLDAAIARAGEQLKELEQDAARRRDTHNA